MSFQRFTRKNIIINSSIAIGYIVLQYLFDTLRSDHFFLTALYLICFYASNASRKFILGFSVFIVFWIIYDAMRIIPNYLVSTVHIAEPYHLEKSLFGLTDNGTELIPCEYFSQHSNSFLDFLSGFFYLNWMPVPLAFATYLFIKDKPLFLNYSIAFLMVNLIGFTIYYIYPAAPPWYVDQYGFELHTNVPGSRAGLARFDEMTGIPVFQNIYNKNSNVLAAMPSLHSAYPLVVLYYSVKKKMKYAIGFILLFVFGIWFSAIYSGHHYTIDVIAGIVTATIGITLFSAISENTKIKDMLNDFSNSIK